MSIVGDDGGCGGALDGAQRGRDAVVGATGRRSLDALETIVNGGEPLIDLVEVVAEEVAERLDQLLHLGGESHGFVIAVVAEGLIGLRIPGVTSVM